jgi:hypothetical protein
MVFLATVSRVTRRLNAASLPHAQTHSPKIFDVSSSSFFFKFYISKRTKLTPIHIVFNAKTRIKDPKSLYMATYKILNIRALK